MARSMARRPQSRQAQAAPESPAPPADPWPAIGISGASGSASSHAADPEAQGPSLLDPWIDGRAKEIRNQIDQNNHNHHGKHHTLHDREIALKRAANDKGSEAGD